MPSLPCGIEIIPALQENAYDVKENGKIFVINKMKINDVTLILLNGG